MGYVLDASALLAFLHGERGGDLVEKELEHSVISSVNWSEALYKSLSCGVKVDGLREDLEALGLSIEPFTAEDAERAAELWPHTRPLGLSLGDQACLALALRLGLPVLTADRVWQKLGFGIDVKVIR